MVGFEGPPADAVKADWKQRQFGGLLIVNLNHNGESAPALTDLIASLRGLSRHRLIAATDQEGGQVCLAVSSVPCAPMPVGQGDVTRMAAGIRALDFDLNLAPVSDVCSGSVVCHVGALLRDRSRLCRSGGGIRCRWNPRRASPVCGKAFSRPWQYHGEL